MLGRSRTLKKPMFCVNNSWHLPGMTSYRVRYYVVVLIPAQFLDGGGDCFAVRGGAGVLNFGLV